MADSRFKGAFYVRLGAFRQRSRVESAQVGSARPGSRGRARRECAELGRARGSPDRDGPPARAFARGPRGVAALTAERLSEVFAAPLSDLDLRVVMIDGILFRDHCVLLALGIDADGRKHARGLQEGSTENTQVAKALVCSAGTHRLARLTGNGIAASFVVACVLFGFSGGNQLPAGPAGFIQCGKHPIRTHRLLQ